MGARGRSGALRVSGEGLLVESEANPALGYRHATLAGLGEYLRAGSGTQVVHSLCGR